jgi:hypothetical protein
MLELAAVLSVTSAIALLLGFMKLAVVTATVSVVLLSLVGIAFVVTLAVVIGYSLAGRSSLRIPPS